MRADAIPEPTFLWWDVRLQPRFGTVEVRIADAQTSVDEAAALAALIQVLVRVEATEQLAPEELVDAPEVLEENRFLAVRDGVEARMVDPLTYSRVPVAELLDQVLAVGRGHARDLHCEAELDRARGLLATPGSGRQRELAREHGPEGMVAALADLFLASEALSPAAAGAPRSPSGEPRTRPA